MDGAVWKAGLISLVGVALGATPEAFAAAQSSFRASLTATVMIASPGERGKTTGGAKDALVCREVILRWAALAKAKRYVIYASARSTGPWAELPASNVCGAVKRTSPTGLVDLEPTAGAPAVVHRLYYKVIALAGESPGAATLDVTDPVSVELQ